MTEYITSRMDKKTGMELILSESTFEHVCYFIESRYTILDAHDVRDTAGNLYTVFDTDERGILLYDDARMLLLGS